MSWHIMRESVERYFVGNAVLEAERCESCLRQNDPDHLVAKSCCFREARFKVLLYILEAILV